MINPDVFGTPPPTLTDHVTSEWPPISNNIIQLQIHTALKAFRLALKNKPPFRPLEKISMGLKVYLRKYSSTIKEPNTFDYN